MYSSSYQQLIQNWTEGFASNKPFTLSAQFFSYTEEQNHEDAVGLMRHVFEEVLGWSPYDVQNHCTKEVIDVLGLRSAYRALMWPYTYDANGKKIPLIENRSGYGYVAALLYPEVIRTLGKKNIWIMDYNALLSGRGQRAFRVDDFLGNDGIDHARLLLNHYLVNHPDERYKTMDDVYKVFGNKKDAEKILKKAKLLTVSQALFSSPLEYLHMSLPDDGSDSSRDHLSYDFYRFENLFHDSDDVMVHRNEIMERYRKNGETPYAIAKSLFLNEEIVSAKIDEWNEILAERFKDKLLTLHKHHVPVNQIAEKSKLPETLIHKKIEQWTHKGAVK